MILKIFLFILLAYLLFELIEHVIIPLFWLILKKKRRPVTGDSGLIGEVGEVKEWNNTEGRVFVHGELWWATSEEPLSPGDKAVVQTVKGLTLKVKPLKKTNG
ncbi:MAG: NfeD family protein [Candidatus Aminicenantes bacterium]|jgi:membrane-bound ClpP family serine protease